MKARKMIAAVAAVLMAASMSMISVSAADWSQATYADNNPKSGKIVSTDANSVTFTQAENGGDAKCRIKLEDILADPADVSKIASGSWTVTYNGFPDNKATFNIGGACWAAVGNSEGQYWINAGEEVKPIHDSFKWEAGKGPADATAEFVFMDWAKGSMVDNNVTITISDIKLFDADGNEIPQKAYNAAAAEKPAETEAPAEEEEVAEEQAEDTLDLDAAPEEEAAPSAALEDPTGGLTFDEIFALSDEESEALGLNDLSDDEAVALLLQKYCEEYGTFLGAGTSSNWGQAFQRLTYNNIGEGDVVGDDKFDSDLLNEDCMVIVFYDSTNPPEFILQSWSGGEGWAKVPPSEEDSIPGIAVFTYDYMTAMYQSEDMSTLDSIYVGDTGADLTVYGAYLINTNEFAETFAKALADNLDISFDDFEVDFDDSDDADDADVDADIEEEAAVEEAAPVEEAPAPAADTAETAPVQTGNMSAAAIAGIMSVAAAAAVAARKRRK